MKKVLYTVLQSFLFLILFAVASLLWHPFPVRWEVVVADPQVRRYFVADGLLLSIGVLIAIIVVQALRKRRCNTPWTILAFVLAIGLGYALKLGYITQEIF